MGHRLVVFECGELLLRLFWQFVEKIKVFAIQQRVEFLFVRVNCLKIMGRPRIYIFNLIEQISIAEGCAGTPVESKITLETARCQFFFKKLLAFWSNVTIQQVFGGLEYTIDCFAVGVAHRRHTFPLSQSLLVSSIPSQQLTVIIFRRILHAVYWGCYRRYVSEINNFSNKLGHISFNYSDI